MTYHRAKELARSFRTVRNNTIKIAEEIPRRQVWFSTGGGLSKRGAISLEHFRPPQLR